MAEWYHSPALAEKRAMQDSKPDRAAPYYMRCPWFRQEDGAWCRLSEGHGGDHDPIKPAVAPES